MEVSNRIIRPISINNSWTQYKTVAICKPTREMNFELFSGCRVSKQNGIPIPLRNASSCFQKPCHVKREDSEGTLSSESIILDEQTLEQELQAAIQEENYSQAAKIRDNLKLLHEDSKAAVLAANTSFYNSFRNGDLAAMQALWSQSENTCVVHPCVSGISGYELVMGSWEYVWADYEFPLSIEVKDVQVYVRGDMRYVRCVEMVRTSGKSWGKQFATNVFEKIDGRWFICVHHASHAVVAVRTKLFLYSLCLVACFETNVFGYNRTCMRLRLYMWCFS